MTKHQKRTAREAHQLVGECCKSLDIGPEELKDLQESDPTLAGISMDGKKGQFYRADGLIYRRWLP